MQPLHPLHRRHISIYSMLKIFRAFKFCCDTSLMTGKWKSQTRTGRGHKLGCELGSYSNRIDCCVCVQCITLCYSTVVLVLPGKGWSMTPCITYKRLREVYSNTALPNDYIACAGTYYLAINSTRLVLSCQAIMYNVGVSCRGSNLVNQTLSSGWRLSIGDFLLISATPRKRSGSRDQTPCTKYLHYTL